MVCIEKLHEPDVGAEKSSDEEATFMTLDGDLSCQLFDADIHNQLEDGKELIVFEVPKFLVFQDICEHLFIPRNQNDSILPARRIPQVIRDLEFR